ncbi:hypothetical protein [Acidiphilium sp.]|uniref:hypothetical protein n=1 Tax=Acidiphilium sp. TaxID=527 RepID=UPI003D0439B9
MDRRKTRLTQTEDASAMAEIQTNHRNDGGSMYVIPCTVLANVLGCDLDPASPAGTRTVEIPVALLRRLIESALRTGGFTESTYLAANPDVASAIRRSEFTCARDHYATNGYYEGRSGSNGIDFDEVWYLKNNPDVARSVRRGDWPSGHAHYLAAGRFELRAPTPDVEGEMQLWRDLLLPVAKDQKTAAA